MKTRPIVLRGLSGAGKTTLGKLLVEALIKKGHPALLIDGDEFRDFLDGQLGFEKKDRVLVSKGIIFTAKKCLEGGILPVISSMFSQTDAYRFMKDQLNPLEVYLEVGLDRVSQKDIKSVYKESSPVVGRELELCLSEGEFLQVQTHQESPQETFEKIWAYVEKHTQ